MKQSEKPIDRVDQFFKNKLEDHTIAPSENAWAKVEAGLSKKNNVIVWRWAAAVLLMGALISIIYWSQRGAENVDPVLVEKKIEKEKSNASSEVKRTANTMSVAKTKVVREDTNHGEVKGVQTLVDKKSRSLEEESSKSKLKLMETEAALAQQYTIKGRNGGHD
ncbi:MAG: hypothetical protein HY015_05145 [Bacteroidetes bacterium]|nr:hypothetical protein [Bacteroidota bacterium]